MSSTTSKIGSPSSYLSTLLRDLNLFVVHINALYRLVFARYVSAHPRTSTRNWAGLMSEARKSSSTNLRVARIFRELGFSADDVKHLQYLRTTRNALCHPYLRIGGCRSLLDQNWTSHRCYSTLRRLFSALEAMHDDVPVLRLGLRRKRSLTNWRQAQAPSVSKCEWRSDDEENNGDSDQCNELRLKSTAHHTRIHKRGIAGSEALHAPPLLVNQDARVLHAQNHTQIDNERDHCAAGDVRRDGAGHDVKTTHKK